MLKTIVKFTFAIFFILNGKVSFSQMFHSEDTFVMKDGLELQAQDYRYTSDNLRILFKDSIEVSNISFEEVLKIQYLKGGEFVFTTEFCTNIDERKKILRDPKMKCSQHYLPSFEQVASALKNTDSTRSVAMLTPTELDSARIIIRRRRDLILDKTGIVTIYYKNHKNILLKIIGPYKILSKSIIQVNDTDNGRVHFIPIDDIKTVKYSYKSRARNAIGGSLLALGCGGLVTSLVATNKDKGGRLGIAALAGVTNAIGTIILAPFRRMVMDKRRGDSIDVISLSEL